MDIQNEIKWRGSTYVMEKVEDGVVYWYNPISRHRESCSIDNWKQSIPYDREFGRNG
jgi:hypothetical protein